MSTDPTKSTQCYQILNELKKGNAITPIDALHKFRCFRLAARIYDLREMGYPIDTFMEEKPDGSKAWANYVLRG